MFLNLEINPNFRDYIKSKIGSFITKKKKIDSIVFYYEYKKRMCYENFSVSYLNFGLFVLFKN